MKKPIIYAWYALLAVLFFGAATGPSKTAWAAVNMSTVAASGNYLAVPGTPGFMPGGDKTKLDALPTAANLITQIDSQALVLDQAKVLYLGAWGAVSAPAVAADRSPVLYSLRDTAKTTLDDSGSLWIAPPGISGTITGMTCNHVTALTTDSITYTVRKNAADTSMVVVVANNTTVNTTTSNPVTFVAGDKISIKMRQSSTQAGANLGAQITLAYKSN